MKTRILRNTLTAVLPFFALVLFSAAGIFGQTPTPTLGTNRSSPRINADMRGSEGGLYFNSISQIFPVVSAYSVNDLDIPGARLLG
ncbi:MAG: hypothetical protein ABJC10_03295 [Acidobacteriota bacterium]